MFIPTPDYIAERLEAFGQIVVVNNSVTINEDERRTSRRVPVLLEAEWEGLSGRSTARISDLSWEGCFIETCGQTTPGEAIRFRLKTPSGRWLQIGGKVAHCQPMIGFGLSFTEMSAEDQTMLRQLLEFYA